MQRKTGRVRWLFYFGLTFLVLGVGLIVGLRLRTKPKSLNISFEEGVLKALPVGARLRDWQRLAGVLPESYLLIYILPGYQEVGWGLDSCPGAILAESIKGKYMLALWQNNEFIDQITIPPAGYNFLEAEERSLLELVYQNSEENICFYYGGYRKQWEDCRSEKKDLVEAKLLNLQDYTGDGRRHEFLLLTTGGGCGFYDGLVAGYDQAENKLVILSDWLPRFRPNSQGEFNYLFKCGDHGGQVRVERQYRFSQELGKFELIWEKETDCDLF